MFAVADTAGGAVQIQLGPLGVLAEGDLSRDAAGRGAETRVRFAVLTASDVPARQRFAQGRAMHGTGVAMEQSGALQFAQNRRHATGAMHVFHVIFLRRRSDLAQIRHQTAQTVDVAHGERDLGLTRGGQQMQHGVGRAAHGDVETHGVLEGGEVGDRTRQHARVVLFVITARQLHDQPSGFEEQLAPLGMGGQQRSVARQTQTQRLGQTVHRIGGEHARAGAAGRTGRALDLGDVGITLVGIGGGDHGIDQIQMHLAPGALHLARFHRPARDEHRRDVQTQRGHQHSGRDLVAVGDADHGIGAMGVDHVLDRVGDDLARGQGVEHPVVAHGDAVVDGDGVEFLGHAAGGLDLARDQLAQILQMHMTGDELGEGVDDGDDGFVEIGVGHAGGAPQGARAGHVAAMGAGSGAILGHELR